MLRSFVLALAVLASGAHASDLARQSLFSRVHGLEAGGFAVTGEHLSLNDGHLAASVQEVRTPLCTVRDVAAQAEIKLDAAFFHDPFAAAVGDVLASSQVTFGALNGQSALPGKDGAPPERIAVAVKDFRLTHAAGRMDGQFKVLVATGKFTGQSTYDAAAKKLTVTLDAVHVAGLPVPLKVAFFALDHMVDLNFVQFDQPRIVIDLGAFAH